MKSKRKLFLLLCLLLVPATQTDAFMYTQRLSPVLKWAGNFPLVFYRININSFPVSTSNSIVNEITSASSLWSFLNSMSRVSFEYTGDSSLLNPISTNIDTCSPDFKYQMSNATNLVFARNTDDADCTGFTCSFIWSCADKNEILHFDIQINAEKFSLSMQDPVSLGNHLSRDFGQILGLSYCSPGDTNIQCESKLQNGQTDPAEESLMYKFVLPAVSGMRNLSEDDHAGLASLYGSRNEADNELLQIVQSFHIKADAFCDPKPCVLPEEETDPDFMQSSGEKQALMEHASRMTVENLNTPEALLKIEQSAELLYFSSLFEARKPAEAIMMNIIESIPENIAQSCADLERDALEVGSNVTCKIWLDEMRKTLGIQISRRADLLEDMNYGLSQSYRNFLASEIKVLIQLRREAIKEGMRR